MKLHLGLSAKAKEAIKVALAMVVVYAIAMQMGWDKPYWAAFTGLIIIGVSSPPESQSAFQVAVLRTQETALGALVYTLVAAFLWPVSSVGLFNGACRKLWDNETQLYHAYRELMSGKGTAEDTRPLRLQQIQQLGQVEGLLNAAESDSYAVWEMRDRWRQFRDHSHALMKALERWRGGFTEIQSLDLNQLLPNLGAVSAELDRRFEQIGRMLAGEAPTQSAQAITLTVDQGEMGALTHFQQAALVVTQTQLANLERLSRSLFDCIADIRGYARQASVPNAEPAPRRRLAINSTFEWIRLAQRVPVLVHLLEVPDDVKLVVGTTASVLVMTGTQGDGARGSAPAAPAVLQ